MKLSFFLWLIHSLYLSILLKIIPNCTCLKVLLSQTDLSLRSVSLSNRWVSDQMVITGFWSQWVLVFWIWDDLVFWWWLGFGLNGFWYLVAKKKQKKKNKKKKQKNKKNKKTKNKKTKQNKNISFLILWLPNMLFEEEQEEHVLPTR